MLRAEIERKAKRLAPAPDPRRCFFDDLLEAPEARSTTEGRRSLARLRFSTEHLLRLFTGVQAMRVTGADVLRYAQLRLKERAAPATVNRELAALRAAYRLNGGFVRLEGAFGDSLGGISVTVQNGRHRSA